MSYWKWLSSLLNVKEWDKVAKGIVLILVGPLISIILSIIIFDHVNEWLAVLVIAIGFIFSFSYGFYVVEVKE